ncbi:wiskott-Aldrich syndrome protein [Triticum aestivum]|uniref:wiskott-Aldrich syndrome protein n=1 Tax=Triticum aestivum TaxID=4565 RepID=UPI000843F38F|nr:wiskott-Aldrich syndrome protein-like [Triticum aestivum]
MASMARAARLLLVALLVISAAVTGCHGYSIGGPGLIPEPRSGHGRPFDPLYPRPCRGLRCRTLPPRGRGGAPYPYGGPPPPPPPPDNGGQP